MIREPAPLHIFEDRNWLVRKPTYSYLPKHELKSSKPYFDFTIDCDNVYTKNEQFRKELDLALKRIYQDQVSAATRKESKLKKYTWCKLRDYIYQQLNNPDLDSIIDQYRTTLYKTIQPNEPKTIIPQLVKCQEIDNPQMWSELLKKEPTSIMLSDKYHYLLIEIFDHIYRQEIIPSFYEEDESKTEVNISNPAEWFSEARKIRRHIIMHIGPTNSGKTYKALQKLKTAESGYYAGPLRLLAREIYDRFKSEGIRCNLLTGEEVIRDLDDMGNSAKLTSGTVEMVPLNKKFDIVVLDEIQMMSDEDRGWAWTNALLGAQAREVHLCGEKSTLPLVRKIVEMTGDQLTINEYERLGGLNVEKKSIKTKLKGLERGDCIVAFSKKKILDLKLEIEAKTDMKVAVIYGSLPPETRVQQANLFNSGEADILVASDAIGMGLNLSIDRIIFSTDLKFNGKELINLSSSNIKQIGGRAGRFKSHDEDRPTGYISSFDSAVLQSVKEGIEAPIEYLKSAVIWPTDKICEQLLMRFPPGTPPSVLLQTLSDQLEKGSKKIFKVSNLKDKFEVIKIFEHMDDIPFLDKLKLSNAPVKDLPMVKKAFYNFCQTIAKGQTRGLLTYNIPFKLLDYRYITDDKNGLEVYEALYNIIMLFFWLSNRYPSYFVDLESATDLKYFCEMIIFEKLDRLKKNPYLRKSFAPTQRGSFSFNNRRNNRH